jgi:phasin family protein
MFTTPEQFAAANKASVDAMLTLANTALASAERIAALNLNTARSMLEDGVANAKAMLGAKDAQEFFSVQASLAQPSLEKAVAYTRSVYEISAQSKEEISKLLEAQFADFQKQSLAPCSRRPPRMRRPVRISPSPPSSRQSLPPPRPSTA